MNKKLLSGFLVTLVLSGLIGSVSFAADPTPPLTGTEAVRDFPLAGGWTKYRVLTTRDKALFRKAMAGIDGVYYEPLVVRTQVVAGMNNDFFCNARLVGSFEWYPVKVRIFKPLNGSATVEKIDRI